MDTHTRLDLQSDLAILDSIRNSSTLNLIIIYISILYQFYSRVYICLKNFN